MSVESPFDAAGKCRVTMTEVVAEQPFKTWVKLLDDQFRFGPDPLGEVRCKKKFRGGVGFPLFPSKSAPGAQCSRV